jgi:histone H3/H4
MSSSRSTRASASPKKPVRSPRAKRAPTDLEVNIFGKETRAGSVFPHNTLVRVLKPNDTIKVSATAAERADQIIHEALSVLAVRAREHVQAHKVVTVQRADLITLPIVACHFVTHLGEYVAKIKAAKKSAKSPRAGKRGGKRVASPRTSSSGSTRELPTAVSTKVFRHYLLHNQAVKYRLSDDAKHAINRVANHMAHELGRTAANIAGVSGRVTISDKDVEVAAQALYPWLTARA